MKYRNLMTVTAVIAFTCGILFALGPPAFTPHIYFYESKAPVVVAWPPPPQWIAYSSVRVLGGAPSRPLFISVAGRNFDAS